MTDYINLLRSLNPLPDELTGKVWLYPKFARDIASELEANHKDIDALKAERDNLRGMLQGTLDTLTDPESPSDEVRASMARLALEVWKRKGTFAAPTPKPQPQPVEQYRAYHLSRARMLLDRQEAQDAPYTTTHSTILRHILDALHPKGGQP